MRRLLSTFLLFCLKYVYKKQPSNFVSPNKCFSIEAAIDTKESFIPILTLLFNSSSWSTINKAFLFGSFANHEELIDSDIDLALFFNEDLSEEDKNKTYERLRKAIEEQIGRKSDMVELLCVDEGYVRSRLGNYKEVL